MVMFYIDKLAESEAEVTDGVQGEDFFKIVIEIVFVEIIESYLKLR
jgi:hypothetical protein